MKTRLLAIGLAIISAALVACGGGGGSNPTPPTPPPSTATPPPTPTPTPTANPFGCVGSPPFGTSARHSMSAPRPIASGDQFHYTGSLQKTFSESAPCPQPTATTSAQVTTSVSDTATTAPDSTSATKSTSSETDAYPTNTTTMNTSSTLEIENNVLDLYATTSDDGTGNSITTSYVNKQEVDDLGTAASGAAWSNNPAANVTESLSDGTAISRTIASDGSYTDTETAPNGVKTTAFVDGSARGTTLDGGATYDLNAGGQCTGSGEVIFAYAPPSGGSITLTITDWALNSKNVCTQGTKTRTFPQWFTVPSGGNGYISDTFVDQGSAAIPPSCNVSASIATSANTVVVETYNVLDPVLGYTEARTTTSYDVTGFGPACVTISDTLSDYYDYSDNTTRIDYQSTNGQPNSVNTITETLGMQSATCGSGGTGPCAQVRRADSQRPISPAIVVAHVGAIEQVRAVQRAQRVEALHRFALQFARGGAVRRNSV